MPENLLPEAKPLPAKTADEINDLFKTLDNEPEPKKEIRESLKEEKEKEEEIEEKPPKEEDEIELVEPEDEEVEKLDLEDKKEDEIEIDAPPRKAQLLKDFPELFKKHPFLEKMLYRDKQYSELFGSFDDAKDLAEKAETYNSFESQLLSGNTVDILKQVKETDEKAFNIIVDDYLPNLAKVDKDAYFHVIGNLNKRLIMEMVTEANDMEKTNPDGATDLKQAALLVNQFIFGSAKFTPPTNRVEKTNEVEDKAKNEVEKERLELVKERFETARDDMQTRVDNKLRATISEYIDPRGVMSPYVKKNAVTDAMKYLGEAIVADPNVVKNLDKLWKASFTDKFSRDTQGKIESYYLSRARANLKNAILKARKEALVDTPRGKRETEEVEETEGKPQRRTITTGRPSQPNNKNGMKKGESVQDFFARD